MDKTDTVPMVWYTSNIITNEPFVPETDQIGFEWYKYSFNVNNWQPLIGNSDENWGCNYCDRYYRGYFSLSNVKSFGRDFLLNIKSDDGIWIYINGDSSGI